MPSLRLLKAFTTLAAAPSFSTAAASLHVTQPALSIQIKDLEAKLGVQLISRGKRGVELTRAGLALLPEAKKVQQSVAQFIQMAEALRTPLAGRLRLGVIPTVAPYLLPKLLPRLQQHSPQAQLQVSEDKTENLVHALRHGQIDAALLALPLGHADLVEYPLFADEFLLAVPATHKLAKQKTISGADILLGPLLLLDDGHCLRDQALSFCHAGKAHSTQLPNFKASSLTTLIELVAGGMGITLVPKMAATPELKKRSGIKFRPLAGAARQIGLITRPGTLQQAEILLLSKAIKAAA